jgi:hypothetical protein
MLYYSILSKAIARLFSAPREKQVPQRSVTMGCYNGVGPPHAVGGHELKEKSRAKNTLK